MSLKMSKSVRTTAAWRISIWPTLIFATGTALAFFIVFLLVSKAISRRSDAWLTGEAGTLAHVASNTPEDRIYKRIVGEVAEMAMQEVPDQNTPLGQKRNPVFFLEVDTARSESPLWVGPDPSATFIETIQRAGLTASVPASIKVQGWPFDFRVVCLKDGSRTIYLGLNQRGDRTLLYRLTFRFVLLWAGTVLMGFLISYLVARRTLRRVESITETVAQIGTEELGKRLPEPQNADEISRLARTFNHMLGRIQSSVDQLRAVTDTVAHDLKSPVTTIRGTLESALFDDPNNKWRDSVAEAIEGLDRMLGMLNTILDVAEGQAGALRLDRSPIDLTKAVQQLADLYQPAMADRNHEVVLDLEEHVFIDADQVMINRVISNLLENELTHLPPGCRIVVRLGTRERWVNLVVEDNGPGFSPEVSARAFERFVKGKNSPGHGLGLAFVDAVVRSHDGNVRISARPGGGAQIAVSLPGGVREPA